MQRIHRGPDQDSRDRSIGITENNQLIHRIIIENIRKRYFKRPQINSIFDRNSLLLSIRRRKSQLRNDNLSQDNMFEELFQWTATQEFSEMATYTSQQSEQAFL